MTQHDLIIYSSLTLALTLVFSWIGDDDVVYAIMNRKPTPNEAIARIRYVFAKFFASLYCGGLIALFLVQDVFRGMLSLNVSKLQIVFIVWLCICLFSLFIGVLQNCIRLLQGRKQRPIFDVEIWRHNLKLWRQRPNIRR
jgi:hypothetical protein